MCDSVRRRRPRHLAHCRLLSRARLLPPLVHVHAHGSDHDSDRVCRAHRPHDRVRAELQDECGYGSCSGQTMTIP